MRFFSLGRSSGCGLCAGLAAPENCGGIFSWFSGPIWWLIMRSLGFEPRSMNQLDLQNQKRTSRRKKNCAGWNGGGTGSNVEENWWGTNRDLHRYKTPCKRGVT